MTLIDLIARRCKWSTKLIWRRRARAPARPFRADLRGRPRRLSTPRGRRLPELGRRREPRRQSALPWARSRPARLDLHRGAHGALHPRHVAHLRGRLSRLGNEPGGLSPHRRTRPCRERRARLLARGPPALPPPLRRGPAAPPPPDAIRLSAALAALVWALHPLRVESVAWITERRDVVSGALALAAT